jgi:hypothetical protein
MREQEWLLLPIFRRVYASREPVRLAKGIGWILREGTAELQEFKPHNNRGKNLSLSTTMQD